MGARIEAICDGATDCEVAAVNTCVSRLWRAATPHTGGAAFLRNAAAYRKNRAPMGRLDYLGSAPDGAEKPALLATNGRKAICGAITNGVSKEEIRTIIHALRIYCGVPQALECFLWRNRVPAEGSGRRFEWAFE